MALPAVVAAIPPSGYAVTNRSWPRKPSRPGAAEHFPALTALVCVVCVPDFNLSGIATTIGLGALRVARVGNTRVV